MEPVQKTGAIGAMPLLLCLAVASLSSTVYGHSRGDRIATGEGSEEIEYAPIPRPRPAHSHQTHAPRESHSHEPRTSGVRRNYIKPLDGPFSRRGFGRQRDPFSGNSRMHYGQDIHGSFGQKIVAAKDGVIVKVVTGCASWSRNRGQRKCGGGFGNHVVIRHSDGNFTYYTHMQNSSSCSAMRNLRNGQRVSQGEKVGCVGSSGNSTGPHLHFEVRAGSTDKRYAIDPMSFLRNWG